MQEYFNIFKINIKKYLGTNILFFSFVFSSVFNAWLLRVFTVQNYFEFKPILADLAVVLIIGSFGYFIKPKKQFRYFFTVAILFTTLCIINSVYYVNYISFTSASLLATSVQLFDVADAVVENILEIKDFIYIWQLVFLLIVNYNLKKRNYFAYVEDVESGPIRALNTIVVGLILIGFFISMLTGLDIGRFGKQWNREYIVMKFGLYTYHVNDLINSLKPQLNPLFGFDENAKAFREYYNNREKLETKNKYTNIFKGSNIIMIHAESIQTVAMEQKFNGRVLTPTLNKLANEGLFFSNFYAQEGVGTSSDTEFTLNTSLMPTSYGTVFVNYWNREYITIPKLLKKQNYYSFSMHGNNGTYWNRNVVHKEFGYDRFYHSKDFEIDEKIGLGLSDKSFFRQAVPKIKEISENNKNFFGTMIMLTNHTPFSDIVKQGIVDYKVDFQYENYNEETKETELVSAPYLEGTKLGNYFKSVHYADEAIGEFLEDLDKEGLLDNTVIIIYGDHDAKLKKSEYERLYNYDPYTRTNLAKNDPNYIDLDFYDMALLKRVPFIIWSKDQKAKGEIKEAMGMSDVMPTLGNMFDFKNPYALGNDIFSVNENIVVFPDGNWITNKMYYNNQKKEGKLIDSNNPISIQEIDRNNKHAEDVISVSNSIIVYDLIKKSSETIKLIEDYR